MEAKPGAPGTGILCVVVVVPAAVRVVVRQLQAALVGLPSLRLELDDAGRDRLSWCRWRRWCPDDGGGVVDAHETSDEVGLEVDDGPHAVLVVVPVAVDHHRLFMRGSAAGAHLMETVVVGAAAPVGLGRRLMVAAHHLRLQAMRTAEDYIAERVKIERQIDRKVLIGGLPSLEALCTSTLMTAAA